ncbi:hypothetical protein [Acinetobacter sp. P1(2025)]|uniref:hypothetical protein n=1 Tax=Acinetobacter sp. P1(2025) TaxID=3446120 RepID=UPI003F52F734
MFDIQVKKVKAVQAKNDRSFKFTIVFSWFVVILATVLINEKFFYLFASPLYVLLSYLTAHVFFKVEDLRWFWLSSLVAAWLVFLFISYTLIPIAGWASIALLPMYVSFYKFSLRVIGHLINQ